MDDRGLKDMVEETLSLTQENNKLLRKMRRAAWFNRFLQLVWLAVIIGVPVYLYLTVFQPYLEELSQTYEGFRAQVEGLPKIPAGFQDFLNNLPQSADTSSQ